MTALMSSPILSRYSPGAFELAVLQCWKRYLPQDLLCKIHKYDTPTRPPTDVRHPLSSLQDLVKKLQTYLEDLVIMGIGKCRNRKLILCPRLFSRRYRATFPVQNDPVHFVRISLSIKEYSAWLKKEYNRRQWHKIATWHCSPPPYPTTSGSLRTSSHPVNR